MWGSAKHTQWMTAAQLRFLGILCRQLIADAIQQLHVTLLGILLQSCNEGPRHGACGFTANGCVLPVNESELQGNEVCRRWLRTKFVYLCFQTT
jgi:hypothetical protein